MGALSFKARFVDAVKAGLQRKKGGKRQSIRNFRKRPLKVGETLYLYYGMRTKWCTKLGVSSVQSRQVIVISETGIIIYDEMPDRKNAKCSPLLKMARLYDTKAKLNRFARADGFKDFEDMKAFWRSEHGKKKKKVFPYIGSFYKW
jgi:hypothetical protein